MREGAWLAISFIGMAIIGIIYSSLRSVELAILLIAISGFLNAPSTISRRLIIQRNTPREMRGRVNSVFFVARDMLFLIGMSAAGLADVMNVRLLYLISALTLLVAGMVVLVIPGLGNRPQNGNGLCLCSEGSKRRRGLGLADQLQQLMWKSLSVTCHI